MFIKRFFNKLFTDFVNIYDDKGVRESYGDKFADELAGADPVTGKRRISVQKILFRIVILAILFLFVFVLIRINTADNFWMH